MNSLDIWASKYFVAFLDEIVSIQSLSVFKAFRIQTTNFKQKLKFSINLDLKW